MHGYMGLCDASETVYWSLSGSFFSFVLFIILVLNVDYLVLTLQLVWSGKWSAGSTYMPWG